MPSRKMAAVIKGRLYHSETAKRPGDIMSRRICVKPKAMPYIKLSIDSNTPNASDRRSCHGALLRPR